jgi:hypothetical protein
VAAAARRVDHLHGSHAAAIKDHAWLEAFHRPALGVAEETRGWPGHGVVAILGNHRGQAGLNLGFHQQRGLIVAEIAQARQHRGEPGDVAQLARAALAVDMQHVAGGDALAAQPGGAAGQNPGGAGMDAMQPVADRLTGLAEADALQGGDTLDHALPRNVEMVAL